MYFDKERLTELAAFSEELISEYEISRFDLKKEVDTEKPYTMVWTDTLYEPMHSDFFEEIDRQNPRKIFKSKPRNLAYRSGFAFDNEVPVYGIIYDSDGKPLHESFYIRKGNDLTGVICSVKTGKLFRITYDQGRFSDLPQRFIRIDLNSKDAPSVDCRVYTSQDGHILSAEVIDQLYIRQDIVLYNDERYENWSERDISSMLTAPPMNPYAYSTYSFIYGSRYAESYVRTDHSHCMDIENEWKLPKKRIREYENYGIKAFIK